jgi:hypothetical protein
MHRVDPEPAGKRFAAYNSLTPADFDQDGVDDYVVIHEFGSFIGLTLLFHPGYNTNDIYDYWEKVVIMENGHTEYAQVGDFDQDGYPDMLSVEGSEHETPSMVRIVWNPGPEKVKNAEAWQVADRFEPLTGIGNPHYAKIQDVDQDGDLDIFVGGRASKKDKSLMGLRWVENPGQNFRDISQWKTHILDEKLWSGHGFIFHDMDEDGDQDIVLNNSDFNTPPEEAALLWYENEGPEKISQPWPRHIIDQNNSYFWKCQVAAGDLNGDGMADLVVPMNDKEIYYFKKIGNDPVRFEKIVIPKVEDAQQLQRPIMITDLNQDGKQDLVCGSLHYFARDKRFEQNDGYIEPQKYVLYWMEYEGNEPGSDNWITHPIKKSFGLNTKREYRGEKIDHMRVLDVDNDGDLDLMVNSEESFINLDGNSTDWKSIYNSKKMHTIFGIAWFENTETTVVASDDFEKNKLNAGQGWKGKWQPEGAVEIVEEGLAGKYKIRLKGGSSITRELAQPVDFGQLEFRWYTSSVENDQENALMEVYDGEWHTLRTVYDDEDDDPVPYHNEMLAISKFDPVTKIRFRMTGDSEDYFFVDEVVVKKRVD